MQLKAVVRYHLTPKSVNNKFRRECREKGTLLHCWWNCKLVQPVWRFLKLKIELTISASITPGHVSGENSNWKRYMHLNVPCCCCCSVMSHDFAAPWTAAHQAPQSFTISRSLLNSCPLSQWCHPTILSSVIPCSSWLQSFPASGFFQWVDFSHQVAKVLELHHQSFQWIFRVDFL